MTITLANFPTKSGTLSDAAYIYISEGGQEKKLTVSDLLSKVDSAYSSDINSFLDSLSSVAGFDSLSKKGANIASATTTNLDSSTGNYINITGTATITGITLAEGKQRLVRFTGALILTNGASLVLPSSSNITTEVGDFAIFVGDAGGVVRCVGYFRSEPILTANRNILINGAMTIDQRNAGASQTITSGAVLAYTIDRWFAYCTGANATGQRVTGSTPNQFNYRFTGASSVTKIGFSQRIEAVNCQHLAGKTAALSVDLANSLLTTVTWVASYANTADIFGSLASPTKTQIATGTFTVNSTLARFTTPIAIPAGATTGIEIEFSVGAQTSGTWTIGRVQFEDTPKQTTFEYRTVQQELFLCQRYYEKSYNQSVVPGTINSTGTKAYSNQNAQQNLSSVFFKVSKRANPTVTLYSPITGVAGKMSLGAVDVDGVVFAFGEDGFYVSPATATALTNLFYQYSAISEL